MTNNKVSRLGLFAAVGIELEYMIVDATTLDVRPIADRLLEAAAGYITGDWEHGPIAWSNELALHVVELKTNGPTRNISAAHHQFMTEITCMNRYLAPLGAQLMPGAMHPWMNPLQETMLWPHDNNPIYEAYHRIFNCQGHGWSNLQSVHINLPFANDAEFGRLHAAIRMVLPLIPALAASSAVVEGRVTRSCDQRLHVYKDNQKRLPKNSGLVIPEPVFSEEEYHRVILQPMYDDILPYDSEGILQEEWLNSRGAIARFDRGAIEIRVMDIQECVRADLAIVAAIVALVRAMTEERWSPLTTWREFSTERLRTILDATILDGDQASLVDAEYLRAFGIERVDIGSPWTANRLWKFVWAKLQIDDDHLAEWDEAMQIILDNGCLARRIRRAVDSDSGGGNLRRVYGDLCRCLATDNLFVS